MQRDDDIGHLLDFLAGKFLSLQQNPVMTALPSDVLTATDCPPTECPGE
jgi:hypothetical protein